MIHECTVNSQAEDNHDLIDIKNDLASFQYTTANECDKDSQVENTFKNIQKDDEIYEQEDTYSYDIVQNTQFVY